MTFNPDQDRDEHGRWTGEGHTLVARGSDDSPAENMRRMALGAENVARDLGFNPQRITVTDEEKTFELNGHSYNYAGAAYTETGRIDIYSGHVSPSSLAPTVAHEVEHQKFNAFLEDYRAERDAIMKESDGLRASTTGKDALDHQTPWVSSRDPVMKADGLLREGYAEKYPLYQRYTQFEIDHPMTTLAASDGISDYSKNWWQAWKDGKAQTDQAVHETLAEMSARAYINRPENVKVYTETGETKRFEKPAPEWEEMFKIVEDNWKSKARP